MIVQKKMAMCLILTDSGVHKRLSDALRITVLFALEDGAGDKLQLELRGGGGGKSWSLQKEHLIQSYIMYLHVCVTCAFLWGVIPLTYFRTMRR